MGALSRQQRRQMARRMAKSGDVKAAVARLENNSEKFSKQVYDQFMAEEEPKIRWHAIGMMYLMFMAYLRLGFKFGPKVWKRHAEGFGEFCGDMVIENADSDQLIKLLDDELHINTRDYLVKLEQKYQQHVKKRCRETGRRVPV